LVEDEEDTAALYLALLQQEGLEAVRCATGREAREWWAGAADKPCLLILDVRLPDADGLELCRELAGDGRGPEKSPAVMVLSAHGDPRMPSRSRQAGAGVFLDKLRDLDSFAATARDLVARKLGEA
jgi:DNA-binding response OmpR family regulator